MERNPIPPDQAVWGRFNELAENNLIIERKILEQAAVESPNRDSNQQKIGDYYASCMDEAAIEKKGLDPLRPELDRIAKLQSKTELPGYLAHAHQIGSNAFFEFSSQPDYKDAALEIAETDQSGLGLPDRDYYLKTDRARLSCEKNIFSTCSACWNSRAKNLRPPRPTQRQSWRSKRRSPRLRWIGSAAVIPPASTIMTLADLGKLSPAFRLEPLHCGAEPPKFDTLNVTAPEFVKGFNDVVPTPNWATSRPI